jgi:hypothetical protein
MSQYPYNKYCVLALRPSATSNRPRRMQNYLAASNQQHRFHKIAALLLSQQAPERDGIKPGLFAM